jgi:hypothetical protein
VALAWSAIVVVDTRVVGVCVTFFEHCAPADQYRKTSHATHLPFLADRSSVIITQIFRVDELSYINQEGKLTFLSVSTPSTLTQANDHKPS